MKALCTAVAVLALSGGPLLAQSPASLATIPQTDAFEFHSEIVDADFRISVSFPFGYHQMADAQFPVLYVPDAWWTFGMATDIARVLSADQLRMLLEVAQGLQLQCLVEVHDEGELTTALEAGAEIIGINNRDLRTFKTDLAVTEALAPKVPAGVTIVSESGIKDRDDMLKLQKLGAHAALVGEAIVTQRDPGAKVLELLGMTVSAGGEERS